MKLVLAYALGAGVAIALAPWIAPWLAIAILAAWAVLVTAAARPAMRTRMAGVAVALVLLAVVTAAPVVARLAR